MKKIIFQTEKQREATKKIENKARDFLVAVYGNTNIKYEITYEKSGKLLILNTSSKILANDLVLRIGGLKEFLKGAGDIEKIVVK